MKTKTVKCVVISLMLAGSFSSCTKEEFSAQEVILGKWELIARGTADGFQQVEPDGSYFMCLHSGKMLTYDSETNVFSEGTYHIDSNFFYRNNNWSAIYSVDKDRLTLATVRGTENFANNIFVFIYKRKK